LPNHRNAAKIRGVARAAASNSSPVRERLPPPELMTALAHGLHVAAIVFAIHTLGR